MTDIPTAQHITDSITTLSNNQTSDIIFFGNGPLADFSLATLKPHFNLLFHARSATDLVTVKEIKTSHPHAYGILASFGTIIKSDLLDLFEPEGILNLHPSLLPKYRGPSPIETAILNGDTDFSISIMKLVKAMDAGPIYYQESFSFTEDVPKTDIYQKLAIAGSNWLIQHLHRLPTPTPQNDHSATYTHKFTSQDSPLDANTHTAHELLNQIRAFQSFPKSKITLYDHDCIVHNAHISSIPPTKKQIGIKCADDYYLFFDRLQPTGKKPMDATSFLNGYAK